jgi:hypothetical protein
MIIAKVGCQQQACAFIETILVHVGQDVIMKQHDFPVFVLSIVKNLEIPNEKNSFYKFRYSFQG